MDGPQATIPCFSTPKRPKAPAPAHILRIAISRDGTITADGTPTTCEALAPQLDALAASKGGVHYYREAAQEEPHPNAMQILEAVMSRRLPLSLSSKPDFSDAIGPDGVSRPRQP